MSETKVPGSQILRATITDECRHGRGDEGVADEAAERAHKAVRNVCGWWPETAGAKIHVVVTLEKPEPR